MLQLMAQDERIKRGGDSERRKGPPLSRCEELLEAHPDIAVLRAWFTLGRVDVFQKVGNVWRHIEVDVQHEQGSQRHYPTVLLSAYNEPPGGYRDNVKYSPYYAYGVTHLLKLHVEDDEQVTPELGFKELLKYPPYFPSYEIRYIEQHTTQIPPQEIVATARIGLEMLKAYREASLAQRIRIYEHSVNNTGWGGSTWAAQFSDGEPGREDMDRYIASVMPGMGKVMKERSNLSINNGVTKAVYALNALNKVTDDLLPAMLPLPPANKREPRRRATSTSAPGRRPAGRK